MVINRQNGLLEEEITQETVFHPCNVSSEYSRKQKVIEGEIQLSIKSFEEIEIHCVILISPGMSSFIIKLQLNLR